MILDHRRGTMLACTAAALMLISGCADDPPPSTLPDVTPTAAQPRAETTESAEPTPSTDPTATLEAEVEDFIRTYIDTLNESWSSLDALARRRTMFADECEICLYGYDVVEGAHERELIFQGEPSSLVEVKVVEAGHTRATALVTSDVPPGQLVDSSDEVVETFEANRDTQRLYDLYRKRGEDWIIVRIEVL